LFSRKDFGAHIGSPSGRDDPADPKPQEKATISNFSVCDYKQATPFAWHKAVKVYLRINKLDKRRGFGILIPEGRGG